MRISGYGRSPPAAMVAGTDVILSIADSWKWPYEILLLYDNDVPAKEFRFANMAEYRGV